MLLAGGGTFLGLPRVRRAGTCASSCGRVVVLVGATGGKVNCPVAVRRYMLGTDAENVGSGLDRNGSSLCVAQ